MQHGWTWLVALAIATSILPLAGGVQRAEGASRPAARRQLAVWPSWNRSVSRVVPILSAGTPGIRLGMAQVTGPKPQVDQVHAVLQLDADFHSVRGKVLVPSDSLTALRRVQGTAVTAVLQYNLLDFRSPKKAVAAPAPRHDNGWHGKNPKRHRHDCDKKGDRR